MCMNYFEVIKALCCQKGESEDNLEEPNTITDQNPY